MQVEKRVMISVGILAAMACAISGCSGNNEAVRICDDAQSRWATVKASASGPCLIEHVEQGDLYESFAQHALKDRAYERALATCQDWAAFADELAELVEAREQCANARLVAERTRDAARLAEADRLVPQAWDLAQQAHQKGKKLEAACKYDQASLAWADAAERFRDAGTQADGQAMVARVTDARERFRNLFRLYGPMLKKHASNELSAIEEAGSEAGTLMQMGQLIEAAEIYESTIEAILDAKVVAARRKREDKIYEAHLRALAHAREALAAVDIARHEAATAQAETLATQLWDDAEDAYAIGHDEFDQEIYSNAAEAWEESAKAYRLAQSEAIALRIDNAKVQFAAIAKAHETALATSGSDTWQAAQDAWARGQNAEARGDAAQAVIDFEQAVLLVTKAAPMPPGS